MSNPDDPQTWIAKARNDLLCVSNNLDHAQVPWDAVCFHAQQAAEKLLKALLVSAGKTAPRIHDLPALLGYCRDADIPIESIDSACRLLNPYSILARYPGAPEPSPDEGRAAAAAAREVLDAVMEYLNGDGSSDE